MGTDDQRANVIISSPSTGAAAASPRDSPPAGVDSPVRRRGAGRGPVSLRRLLLGLAGLLVVLLVVCLLGIVVGSRPISLGVVLDALRDHQPGNSDHEVVSNRIVRLLAGLLVGLALGLAGTIMQAVTRNPLADPGLFGVNAGAAFAVVCAISLLGITTAVGYIWFAFVGAALASALVYTVGATGRDGAAAGRLALAGAAVHGALTSLTTAVLLTDTATFDQYRFWTVGSLVGRQATLVAQIAPFIGVGAVLALSAGRLLNTLSLGEDVARGLGQRVGAARATAAAAAVVLCAAATALAGPLWFVGLLAPHLARLLTGPDHRWLLPYSALIGAILLVAADVAGRVLARPGELQVGVLLAFLGAPFLILLIRRRKLAEL